MEVFTYVDEKRRTRNDMNLGGLIIRILVSMVVLAIAAFFTPNFSITGLVPLFLAAVAIGVIDWVIERFTGFDATPFGRGIVGFIVSAIIIYVAGALIRGVTVSFFGAILAAAAIGLVNMIIPGEKKVF